MKLRINGNSLRLRVSRSELARLQAGERIEETIHFAATPEAKLTYALESALQPLPVILRYGLHEIAVILSEDRARTWQREDEIGVYTVLDLGPGGSLEVAVEKDFACLGRSEEEKSDTFANPHAAAIC